MQAAKGNELVAQRRTRWSVMPTWGATIWGVLASAALALVGVRFLLKERRISVLGTSAAAALLGPLLWDLVLRHTGGKFLVDAPGYVFPVSFEDTGSGIWATAIAAIVLGFGSLRTATGRRIAQTALICGLASLLVDIYLY
jgi:hypothetical protein